MQFIFSCPTHGMVVKLTPMHQETSPKVEANLQSKLMSMTKHAIQPFRDRLHFAHSLLHE